MRAASGRSRREFLALSGTALLGVGACGTAERQTGPPHATPSSSPPGRRSPTPASSPTPTSSPATSPATSPARSPSPSPTRTLDPRALERDLDRYLADRPGRVTLAFRERASDLDFRYRPRLRCFTASCVKVEILVALLLQAQAEDRQLTDAERALAAKMIKVSDNEAANTLWHRIGGPSGLAAANRRLGLRSTTPPRGEYWADTLTSAADQVRLLRSLVRGGSPLHTIHRRYVLGLMRDVVPEQSWGVSVAAREGDVVALKNGWFPTAFHQGLWVIDSVGRVRGPNRDLLIAVLSDHNPSSAAGIQTVERAVELVAEHLP